MRRPIPPISKLLKKLASRAGVKVVLEPEYGHVGQIITKSGRKRYFRRTIFDLNTMGACIIASDKDHAAHFMAQMGYPVPEGRAFYSSAWCKRIGSTQGIDAAWSYARKLGLPVIVKPNSKCQGTGVSKSIDKKEFYAAFHRAAEEDKIILVQRMLPGTDYRVVVLDGEVISAYGRTPLSVTGDGRSTVQALLSDMQRAFVHDGRDTILESDDPRIRAVLARRKMRLSSVPRKGERIALLDNSNLSTGGESEDVTDLIHSGFKRIAVELTRDMNLRFSGVDIMVDGDITKAPQKGAWWVIEINDAPGLDHYAASGAKQKRVVEDMYLKVLKSMNQ